MPPTERDDKLHDILFKFEFIYRNNCTIYGISNDLPGEKVNYLGLMYTLIIPALHSSLGVHET